MKTKISNLLLLTAMIALLLSVNAEEAKPSDFNDEQTVVVGEVDTPVYSVDIEWGNFSYDWKYDKETNKFEFQAPLACHRYEGNSQMIQSLQSDMERGVKIYSDDQCSTEVNGTLSEGTNYYKKSHKDGRIRIVDNSVNGRVKAKTTFTPAQPYSNWVVGKFYGSYVDFDDITGTVNYTEELTDGYLKLTTDGFSERVLIGFLKLDVNNDYTGEKIVEAGSTIGTVTLEISEDTN